MGDVVSQMLRNDEGEKVDPVPFIVVTGIAFVGCYSFFPVYFLTLGIQVPVGLVITTGIFLVLAGSAYSRFVRKVRPEIRQEVPAKLRLQKIIYAAIAVTGLFILLTMIMIVLSE